MQTRKLTEVPQSEFSKETNFIVEIDEELKRVPGSDVRKLVEGEADRAKTAEKGLGDDLEAESVRAARAENTNADNLAREVTRAEAAEDDIRYGVAGHLANKNNPHGVTAIQVGAATSAQGEKADAALPKSGGTITGVVTAPTAAPGTNTTQLATTQFVTAGLDELKKSVSDGKKLVADAITNKGQATAIDAAFKTMADNIARIEASVALSGNAAPGDVLSGKTFYSDNSNVKNTGTIPDQGSKKLKLRAGGKYTIPRGYHNGSGVITAESLYAQTYATATAEDIATGKTAWVEGDELTGSLIGYRRGYMEHEGTGTIPIRLALTEGDIFVEFTDSFWRADFGFIIKQNNSYLDNEYSIYKDGKKVVDIRVSTSSAAGGNFVTIVPDPDNYMDLISSVVTRGMESIE